MAETEEVGAHCKISPTAKFVAYLRVFTDIPHSKDISDLCGAADVFAQIIGDGHRWSPESFSLLAAVIEMRYKSVDFVARNFGTKNLLELAAGVSPRGLVWSRNGDYSFMETDLPGILKEKVDITLNLLAGKFKKRLFWSPVDVTANSPFAVAECFSEGPITILNEGLLPYLDRSEQAKAATSIHELLKKRGGVWVTPDLSSDEGVQALMKIDPNFGDLIRRISAITGRDLQKNWFKSEAEAEEFFGNLGFKLTKWKQSELVPKLSVSRKMPVDQDKLNILSECRKVWLLKVQ